MVHKISELIKQYDATGVGRTSVYKLYNEKANYFQIRLNS